MKLTIENTFHNTSVNVIIKGEKIELTPNQVKRVTKQLCGIDGCCCGQIWNPRFTHIEGYENCYFEPVFDSRSGKLKKAIFFAY